VVGVASPVSDLIYNPANPSERIHFFDAFDSNGVLMPAYRGWKSVSPSGNYSMTFTITDPDGNSMVTDYHEYLPARWKSRSEVFGLGYSAGDDNRLRVVAVQ